MAGAHFSAKSKRIGLGNFMPVTLDHMVFVHLSGLNTGNEPGPDTGNAHRHELVGPVIPAVKITCNKNLPGIGCPDRKTVALLIFLKIKMRSEYAV